MRKRIISLCSATALIMFAGVLSAEDGSETSPFTDIGHAHYVPDPGIYHFNIGENTFSSYVDKDGWLLIAAANKDASTPGSYAEVDSITLNSDQILSNDIRTSIAGITELRINATQGADTPFDVNTNEQLAIDNFYSDQTLSKGDFDANKGSKWTGTGIERMEFSCASVRGSLKDRIYHACGNAQGLHWNPIAGQERVNYTPGTNKNDLNLWARGVAVEPSSSGILTWVLIILGLIIIGAGVFVFIKQKGKTE